MKVIIGIVNGFDFNSIIVVCELALLQYSIQLIVDSPRRHALVW